MNAKYQKPIFVFLFVVWTIFILYGSLAPSDELPVKNWWADIPYFDKIVHFGFYFVEMVIISFLFNLRRLKLLWGIIAILLFSGAIECFQPLYFNRSGNLYDLIANMLGALCGLIAVKLIRK